jgi:flagellar assembly factor FliW
VQTHTVQFEASASSTSIMLHFPAGLLGFPDVSDYVLLDLEPDMPCKCLQAAHGADLAFIVIDPCRLMPDYRVAVDEQDLRDLDVHDPKALRFLAILTIPVDAPEQTTANLQGSILVNTENHHAKQLVLVQSPYHTRHPLLSLAHTPA